MRSPKATWALSSFEGIDEKPWVISGMEDCTSNPLYKVSKQNKVFFSVHAALDQY